MFTVSSSVAKKNCSLSLSLSLLRSLSTTIHFHSLSLSLSPSASLSPPPPPAAAISFTSTSATFSASHTHISHASNLRFKPKVKVALTLFPLSSLLSLFFSLLPLFSLFCYCSSVLMAFVQSNGLFYSLPLSHTRVQKVLFGTTSRLLNFFCCYSRFFVLLVVSSVLVSLVHFTRFS